MASATAQPAISAKTAAGVDQLSQIPVNLQRLKAAGQVIIPRLAQAMALLPNHKVETTEGRVFRVASEVGSTDISVEAPDSPRTLLNSAGRDKHWAMFRQDLPQIVETLLQDPRVQALADPKLEQQLERIAQALDD